MPIHSSTVVDHGFARTKRRGYDPAEVDAVMRRLAAALQHYESLGIDAGGGDGPQGFVTEARMLSHQLEVEARRTLAQAEQQATQRVGDARAEAARILEGARRSAATIISRRRERAESLITSALAEVKALRGRVLRESADIRLNRRNEAAALLRSAELQAGRLVAEARHEAGTILGRARRDHTLLEQRIAQLRSIVANIEEQFDNLAISTRRHAEIVSAIARHEPMAETDESEASSVIRLTPAGLDIDLTPDREPEDPEPTTIGPRNGHPTPMGKTIYQRRGGGIRRRIDHPEEFEQEPS